MADRRWTSRHPRFTIRNFMSALFFKRFLQKPFQIASIIPSSKALVERVAGKMDFSEPRVVAEYGPGEGVHSRECTPSPGPYSATIRGSLKSILPATRSTSALELGIMEAI